MKAQIAAFAFALSACVPPVTTPPIDIAPVSSREARVWTTSFNLRSYRADGETEVAGAVCQVEGRNIAGTATTPARIRFPVFRSGLETTRLTCTWQGETVVVEKRCRYNSSEPSGSRSVDVSSCNQSNVPIVFRQ